MDAERWRRSQEILDRLLVVPAAEREALLAEQRFAVNYVFQYSARPATRAADLTDDVPLEVKQERNRRLLAAAERVQAARLAESVDRLEYVHVESVSERAPNTLRGRTRHGLPASLRGDARLVGSELRVRIEEASAFGLAGRIVEEHATD